MFSMLRYYVVMLMLMLFDFFRAPSVCNIFFWKPLVSSSVWFLLSVGRNELWQREVYPIVVVSILYLVREVNVTCCYVVL